MKTLFFKKGIAEEVDYSVSWADTLTKDSDTIVSSLWVVPSLTTDHASTLKIGLDDTVVPNYGAASPTPTYTLGGTSFTTTTSKIFLKGGSSGKQYKIENRITTALGRKLSALLTIQLYS